MLSNVNLGLLLPHIILAVAAVIVMLSIAVKRNHQVTYVLTLIGTIVAFGSLFYLPEGSHRVTTLFIVDGFSIFFTGLVLLASLVVGIYAFPYLKNRNEVEQKEEFYVLLLLATVGAISMVISNHFISFLLSLEVMNVSLFALISYLKKSKISIEAGVKYLIMAGVSSAILLFGFALIYAQTGAMELSAMADSLGTNGDSIIFIAGMALVVVGIGFELALVPFHFWTPDIYSGASAPVATFVSTIAKGSVFAFLIRLYTDLNGDAHNSVWITFAVLAIASMLIGNWLALQQNNIKRLLAYSSVGHLGYMIVALLAASVSGVEAAAFYLVAYFISMLAAFGIVSYLSQKDGELIKVDDYRGLFWRRPWIAALFAGVLLSLAGIPLTAGFLGKFYLLFAGVDKSLWLLVIVLVVGSSIGLFYYLRVVIALFSGREENQTRLSAGGHSILAGLALISLFFLLFWVGMFPSGLVDVIQNLVGTVM